VDEEEVFRRLSAARKEIENYREYGYILVNDILDRAVAQLEAIVLAERYYRNGEPIAYRSRRVLEVAAACLQHNSQERLKPVLEAFGISSSSEQQQFNFGDDPDEDDSNEQDSGSQGDDSKGNDSEGNDSGDGGKDSMTTEKIPATIETGFDSNYRKVLVAARRARQIQSGAHTLVPAAPTRPAALRRTRLKPARFRMLRRRFRW